jgi:DNA-3-methyladenine glycosylase
LKKPDSNFYLRKDVVQIARDLLGKIIVSEIGGLHTSARIVETEAYVALTDRASHSFGGRRTARNEHMYGRAGISYVYICYGIHHLLNVVTNQRDVPDAVLIRGAEPLEGLEVMLSRVPVTQKARNITRGPGNLSRALGITKAHSGLDLRGTLLYICDDGLQLSDAEIGASPRIGVDSAGSHALLPYRFYVRGHPYVSGSPFR